MMPIYAMTRENPITWFGVLPMMLINYFIIRRIEDPVKRRWTVTFHEALLLYNVLGHNVWDLYLSVFLCAAFIKFVGPKYCHWLCVLTFLGVQLYFRTKRFYLESMPDFYLKDYMYMKLICLMCGVSTDIHYSHIEVYNKDARNPMYSRHDYLTNPSFSELVHYGFTIVTLGGNYHRFRTYNDFIYKPFAKYSKPLKILFYKLPLAYLVFFAYMKFHGEYFPENYVFTDEFRESTLFYKLFYTITQNHAFRLFILFSLLQNEILYVAAGFGAYPVEGKNLSGHGPSENYEKIIQMTEEECAKAEYDFNTVNLVNPITAYFSPWIIEIAKDWNSAIQYWVSSTGYRHVHSEKNIIKKFIGTHISLWLSSYWHGYEIGFFFSSIGLINLGGSQQNYYKVYQKTKGWVSVIFWIFQKISLEFLLGFAIYAALLIETDHFLYFMRITYWMPFILGTIYNLFSLFLYFVVCYNPKKTKKSL